MLRAFALISAACAADNPKSWAADNGNGS